MARAEILLGTPDEGPRDEALQAGADYREFEYPGFSVEPQARQVDGEYVQQGPYFEDGEDDYPRTQEGDQNV